MELIFPFFSKSRQALIVYIIYERILLICILSLVDINWHLNQLVTDPYQPLIRVALTCENTEVSRFFLLRNARNIIFVLQEFQVLKNIKSL